MKRYFYKAKDAKGASVQGEVQADSSEQAVKLLKKRDLFIISISEREGILEMLKGKSSSMGVNELTNFTRQFSTMINAGLPITEALLIIRQGSKPAVEQIVGQILADVEQGEPLSSAMVKFPRVFSKTYIALIKSGETGGVLDEVLKRLADDLEKEVEFRGKVKGALIYPIIIVIGMLIVGIGMVVFVIPNLAKLYDDLGAELPLSTKILVMIANIFINFWPILLILLAIGLYSFKIYRESPKGSRALSELVFKIPIVGELNKLIVLTNVTRTLSLMVGSGVSILEGLSITSGVVPNKVISEALTDVSKMVEKGFPLGYAFAKHPEAFPFILSQMVAVGEETGKMDEVLEKVSHVFQVESEQKVKALTTAIEPIILMVMGVGVIFLIISVILPIYNLTQNL